LSYSQPNEHGVYVEEQCAEVIRHVSVSGAEVKIFLANTENGWAPSLWIRYCDGGRGSLPSINSTLHLTKQEAIDEQLLRLEATCNEFIAAWHSSDLRKTQSGELLDWVALQKQMDLFDCWSIGAPANKERRC